MAARGSSGTPPQAPAFAPVDVVVISQWDDLLVELGPALAGRGTIRPAESAAEAASLLAATPRGQMLVMDTRDVADVRAELQQVLAEAPQAVVLILALPAPWKQISAAVRGLPVQAMLPLPLDPNETSLETVLESALSEAVARVGVRRSVAASRPPAAQTPAALALEPVRGRSRSGGKPPVAIIAAVVLVIGGAAAWYFMSGQPSRPASGGAAPAGSGAQAQIESALVTALSVDELLEKARAAMKDRRYFAPSGDNALVYYRSAVKEDPNSAEARDGLQRVAALLASRLDEAISGGHLEEAAVMLGNLRLASPGEQRLPALALQVYPPLIQRAENDGDIERAADFIRQAKESELVSEDLLARWRTQLARRQEEVKAQRQQEARIQRLTSLVADALRDGRLIDPASDNARGYVQQLGEAAPGSTVFQRAQHDLAAALLRKAHDSVQSRNGGDVDRWLQEARSAGASTAEIDTVRREVAALRQQAVSEALLAQLRERLRADKLTEPQDSAAYYLAQMQAQDATQSIVTQATHELAAKLLERARTFVTLGKGPLAEADLAQARRYGADAKDVGAVQQLVAALTPARPAPATESSTSAASSSSMASRAEPKRIRYMPPEFPSSAMRDGLGGHVRIGFTIDVEGEPRDVRVLESEPPGVFDRAVITAVKRWRYEPKVVDGQATETHLEADVKFDKPK